MIAVSRTNRGLVRHNNEDSVLVREPDLFAIADGMGGADAGEVASYEAVHLLESSIFPRWTVQTFFPPWKRQSFGSIKRFSTLPVKKKHFPVWGLP